MRCEIYPSNFTKLIYNSNPNSDYYGIWGNPPLIILFTSTSHLKPISSTSISDAATPTIFYATTPTSKSHWHPYYRSTNQPTTSINADADDVTIFNLNDINNLIYPPLQGYRLDQHWHQLIQWHRLRLHNDININDLRRSPSTQCWPSSCSSA